jgi:DNA polymerase-1
LQTIVTSADQLTAFYAAVDAHTGPWIGWDTETAGPSIVWRKKSRPDPYRARLVAASASTGTDSWYFPREWALQALPRLFDYKQLRGKLVAHNLKFDLQILCNEGIGYGESSEGLNDSMVAAWLCGWGAGHKSLALKNLAAKAKLRTLGTFEDVAKGRSAYEIPTEELAPYAMRDAELCVELMQRAWPRLEKFQLVDHYAQVDMPLVEILRAMEAHGMSVDIPALGRLRAEWSTKCDAMAARFRNLTTITLQMPAREKVATGEFFKNGKPKYKSIDVMRATEAAADITNTHTISRWLYDEMKLWPTAGLERGANGCWPVDKETLERHAQLPGLAGELAQLRLDHVRLDKLVGTYIDALCGLPPQYADGRLHAAFHLCGTETQRLSSSGPNLQNMPSHTEEGKRIRAALQAGPGKVITVHDYSQIELRLAAHFSRDPEMVSCYAVDEDIHAGTLAAMRKLWPGAERVHAKVTNFSSLYNISPRNLAVKMRATEEQAAASIEAFFARFAKLRNYHEAAERFGREHGYAQTLGGYKRFIDPASASWQVRNILINTPIQGSAAELAKRSMIALWRRWRDLGIWGQGAMVVAQEHDSIVCEVNAAWESQALHDVKTVMEGVWPTLRVPLVADGSAGANWSEAK